MGTNRTAHTVSRPNTNAFRLCIDITSLLYITFMHLVNAFIQSCLHHIQPIHFISTPEIKTHAWALLAACSTS